MPGRILRKPEIKGLHWKAAAKNIMKETLYDKLMQALPSATNALFCYPSRVINIEINFSRKEIKWNELESSHCGNSFVLFGLHPIRQRLQIYLIFFFFSFLHCDHRSIKKGQRNKWLGDRNIAYDL